MASIFDFAIAPDWDRRIESLAEMAEPERWTYLHAPAPCAKPILDSYVRHTFLRASDQQKIIETDSLACFNTGLLTPGQEEILGVFTISNNYNRNNPISQNNKKWYLKCWARSGDRILTELMKFPTLADYWSDPQEIIFDPRLQVQLNLDHIIRDNLCRFPKELGGEVDINGVPANLAGNLLDDEEIAEGVAAEAVEIPISTRNALEGAMKHSIRLAQRSYRIAVPQFYRGRIQLLLPLYLRTASRPDLALTLERNGDWYRAATVLYTDWAYAHARLLARPNSEWLGGFRADILNIVN